MKMDLKEKLKSLRKSKNISQEKLAEYLNVSFQAVSKWENGNTYPDITLLPDIARFYGITIDELLQVEKIDEDKLYQDYYNKAEKLFNNKEYDKVLELWLEAYKQMPNNIQVKEMLMSAYYDLDKIQYQNEIIELGHDIYNSDSSTYYKGQAIHHLANLYATLNNDKLAYQWANRSFSLLHCKELLFVETTNGQECLDNINWCINWFMEYMYYFAKIICNDKTITVDNEYKKNFIERVIKIYESFDINPKKEEHIDSMKLFINNLKI